MNNERIATWESKLLDTSRSNPLINLKPGYGLQILSPGPEEILKIQPGQEIQIGEADRIFWIPPREKPSRKKKPPLDDGSKDGGKLNKDARSIRMAIYREIQEVQAPIPSRNSLTPIQVERIDGSRKALGLGMSLGTNRKYEDAVLDLYRKTKIRYEETGVESLFLSVGTVEWKDQDEKSRQRRAIKQMPMILVPVTLNRESARKPITATVNTRDAILNPALAEKFDISLSAIDEPPVPLDDWNGISTWLKDLLGNQPDFAGISLESRISILSYAKHKMWHDLRNHRGELTRNPVIGAWIGNDAHVSQDMADPAPDWNDLDRQYPPNEIFTVLPADASQLRAIIAASHGRNFVLEGPPGTGKSQTIVNIIANRLQSGKTVLFVSEKMAALDVVRQKLNEVGLGSYCLDLHGREKDRTAFYAQFRITPEIPQRNSREFERSAGTVAEMRERLNQSLELIHEPHSNGRTIHGAIGEMEQIPEETPEETAIFRDTPLRIPDPMRMTEAEIRDTRAAIRTWVELPEPSPESFDAWGNATRADPEIQEQARNILTLAEKILNMAPPDTQLQILRWTPESARTIFHVEGGRMALNPQISAVTAMRGSAERRQFEKTRSTFAEAWRTFTGQINPGILSEINPNQAQSLHTQWRQAGVFGKWKAERDIRKHMGKWCGHGTPTAKMGEFLGQATKLHGLYSEMTDLAKNLGRQLPEPVDHRSFEGIWHSVMQWEQKNLLLLQNAGVSTDEMATIWASSPAWRREFWHGLRNLSVAADAILGATPGAGVNGTFGDAVTVAKRMDDHADSAWIWQTRKQGMEALNKHGLGKWAEAGKAAGIPARRMEQIFTRRTLHGFVQRALLEKPQLADGIGSRREGLIREYQQEQGRLDRLAAQLTIYNVATRFAGSSPKWTADDRILKRETQKIRRQMSPRSLLGKIPERILNLKPCMMMSPLSVAEALPHGMPKFDTVIFDEASQIETQDAIGAILRANQVIVVGDPQQMPPSEFFSQGSDPDDENDDTSDLPSVLDECLTTMPTLRLNWHYRSLDEELIAFSNSRYYGGTLTTFPDPDPGRADTGIMLHRINGNYDRGKSTTNAAEAVFVIQRLTDLIMGGETSLGVITFNARQQALIERLWEKHRAGNTDLESRTGALENEILIKNIENVQGDERDIVLFSTTYGPDPQGILHNNFGPLAKTGGERRFNVAITRARKRLEIVTSIDPEMINPIRAKPGVADLRDYLLMAEGRNANTHLSESLGDPDSLFEVQVIKELERLGWKTQPQIGCSGFRIDLGIIHPDKPNRYLAGVECDGATYHSFKTARDRDAERQKILERLGWKIVRVWSTDWFRNRKQAINRLHQQLNSILEEEEDKHHP